MKDKVEKSILNNFPGWHKLRTTAELYYFSDKCASEIADMVQKFVEWKDFGQCPFIPWFDIENGQKVMYYTDEVNPERYTIDELFIYWFKNIYNIKDK